MRSLSLLSILALVALMTLSGAALADGGALSGMPLALALFGRLHMPLLHFPVVLLMGVLFLEVTLRGKVDVAKRSEIATLILSVTAVLSTLTALAGLAYAAGEDFSGASAQTFWLHRAGGIGVAVVSVLLLLARRSTGPLSRAYGPLLVVGVLGVAATGHQGGELVHGEGFYTRPLRAEAASDGDRGPAGDDGPILSYDDSEGVDGARLRHPEGSLPEKPDYVTHIQPLFKRSCVKCHGPEKRKSGLRLDEKRYALKGGESGPVALVPGDADKSLIFTMCGKAPDDDDVMPPKGKLLALSEIETLKRWIEQGAVWPEPAQP